MKKIHEILIPYIHQYLCENILYCHLIVITIDSQKELTINKYQLQSYYIVRM